MRTIKLASVIVLTMFAFIAHAQDVIVKKDGSTITSKVTEITESEIKYKKFSNQNGPTYVIGRNEVNYINYENGERETINGSAASSNIPNNLLDATQESQNASDSQLLNKYFVGSKAKKLRRTAYIGGGILLAISIPFFALNENGMENHSTYAVAFAGAGVIWTYSFLLAAKRQSQKEKLLENTSVPIMQFEIMNNKQSSLYANINLIKDGVNKNKTLGIGLNLNF